MAGRLCGARPCTASSSSWLHRIEDAQNALCGSIHAWMDRAARAVDRPDDAALAPTCPARTWAIVRWTVCISSDSTAATAAGAAAASGEAAAAAAPAVTCCTRQDLRAASSACARVWEGHKRHATFTPVATHRSFVIHARWPGRWTCMIGASSLVDCRRDATLFLPLSVTCHSCCPTPAAAGGPTTRLARMCAV